MNEVQVWICLLNVHSHARLKFYLFKESEWPVSLLSCRVMRSVCGHQRCLITKEEEELLLSQELTIWYLKEPAVISESLPNPRKRKPVTSASYSLGQVRVPKCIITSCIFVTLVRCHCCSL